MDGNFNKSLTPENIGSTIRQRAPRVPDESLLDENYFLNSEVLTKDPFLGADEEQNYLLNENSSPALYSQGSMEEGRIPIEQREIHINNLQRLTQFIPHLSKQSMIQSIRTDFRLSTEREAEDAYSSKETLREHIFQDKLSREPESRLKGSFNTKKVQMEESSRAQLAAPAPDSNFREYSQQPKVSEGELKISAVFSVSGSPLAPQLSSCTQAPLSSPGLNKSLPAVPVVPAVPAVPTTSVRVSCSGCKKILQKGQTAYQRKGSTQLFCSTICLTGYNVPPARPPMPAASRKTCSSCSKVISNPKDVITAQFDEPGGSKDFCSQSCLSTFEIKRKASVTIHNNSISTKCSVCLKNAVIRHEVNYQNVVHKLCSDSCFSKFRSANNLTMNCCENCGGYCYSGSGQCHLLNIDGQCKKFCSSACVTAFKQKSAKITPCALCKTLRSSAEMIENTNNMGRTELYCSVNCLSAYRVQSVTSSGVQIQCNSCKSMAIPQYHLAMSDGSIRNFCSYNCVVSFQNLFSKSPGVNSSVVPLSQGQVIMNVNASTATQAGSSTQSVVSATSTTSTSTVSNNNSAAAGLQRLAAQSQTQQQNNLSRLAAKLRCQHCSRLFSNKPDLLDYKMGKCESCKRQGKLNESLKWRGEMKHFCNLMCLVMFCSQQSTGESSPVNNTASNAPMIQPIPASTGSSGTKDSTPVIANVVSLASAPAAQPTANSTNVLQGAVPTVTAKIIGDASTQTDALKLPPSQPPRLLKNKALLCKPISQTKATSCKPHTQHKECQTEDDGKPQILVLPVPVPVFVPVPMHLYTQFAPVPFSVPLPVPVPMLIPTTLDNADKIIDTIEDLKEKVPSDPFEADILQMAEMIAEDEEKEKTLSHGDQGSTYSGDLESEAVSTPHSWEDELNHYTLRSNNLQETDAELQQLPREGIEQDLETDFPTALFYFHLTNDLSIFQFLFENGRIDNIFMEPYSRFMVELTKLLKNWHPPVLPNGYLFSRIEEEHLWECKQLGAYSPIILLNTLLFFTTKFFQLKTVTEHQQLSFAYVMRRTKTLKYNTKTTYLRFMPPFLNQESEHEKVTGGKRKRLEDEDGQFVMEMAENTDNPLRCPVRLYEFYLSKCSESVKQRSDVFYLQPERSCVPNSPMWFSTMPIDLGTLESMLTRILMVREIHEELTKAKEDSEGELSD
uniref:TRASH domain-containing protein n=1 Tax=Pyxicephalus adspersus TaxID=30357 RepID=A0AAV3BBA2_PYXAD|nr:TPA: hypothetical protein GDO54_001327 [Pyxicephalus adspersus]